MAETTTDEVASSNEEAQTETTEAQETAQPTEVPRKFVGKSPSDIINSYNDLERQFHKVSSERAEERKAREATDERIRSLESRLSQQPQQSVQASREEDVDPLETYEEEFENDPKQAIKNVVSKVAKRNEQQLQQVSLNQDANMAQEYYSQKVASDPDFAKLTPKMQAIAQEYADLAKPDKLTSVKMLKLLHLAARGASVDGYVSDAVTRAKKDGQSIRQEKRGATSESAQGSSQSDKVNFADMSLEDMEKFLGRSDD